MLVANGWARPTRQVSTLLETALTCGRQECGTATREFSPCPRLQDPVQGAIDASTQGQAEQYSYNIWPPQARMKCRRQKLQML